MHSSVWCSSDFLEIYKGHTLEFHTLEHYDVHHLQHGRRVEAGDSSCEDKERRFLYGRDLVRVGGRLISPLISDTSISDVVDLYVCVFGERERERVV